jgi:hypothetical protein
VWGLLPPSALNFCFSRVLHHGRQFFPLCLQGGAGSEKKKTKTRVAKKFCLKLARPRSMRHEFLEKEMLLDVFSLPLGFWVFTL